MILQKFHERGRQFSVLFFKIVIASEIGFNNLDWVEPKANGRGLQMLAISCRLLSILTDWPQSAPPPSIWNNANECSRTHVNRVLMQLFALTDRRSSISALFESVCLYPTTSFPTSYYYLSTIIDILFDGTMASNLF